MSKTYFIIFHKSRHKDTRHVIKLAVNGNYIKVEKYISLSYYYYFIEHHTQWYTNYY